MTAAVQVVEAPRAIMSGAGYAAGDLEFIAFTSDASPEEIEAFYTGERMSGEGWSDREESGCGVTAAAGDVGGMCAFYKEGQTEDSTLIIVAAPEDGGATSISYIRIDANPEAMAAAAAE